MISKYTVADVQSMKLSSSRGTKSSLNDEIALSNIQESYQKFQKAHTFYEGL